MLSNKRLVAVCSLAFCCNIALLAVFVKFNIGEHCYVTIEEHQEPLAVIPDDFLSIGIDTSEFENYDRIDFTKPRFRQLASALAPARLRLGGTMSERLVFSTADIPLVSCKHCPVTNATKFACAAIRKLCKHKFLPYFLMTGDKWTEINEFCKIVGVKLLFTFNLLLREGRQWDGHNAAELLEYSSHKGYKIDWQLGNEPNSFRHVFNISISPETLAHDFLRLRKLLNQYGYKKSLLVGPDTTRPQPKCPYCLEFMTEFLGNGSEYINIRSWHQYYLNSRTAKLKDFWSPDTFDLLEEQIQIMKNHTAKYNDIPMWLTETSSSYGGGAPGLSNSFAGSPLWLDKLGLAAKYNITTVVRQSFFGGNYSLIDSHLDPLPDWWISVLYKKLVGNKVLSVECKCSRLQRMYAHCANSHYTNDTTAITLFAVNLEFSKARFLLNGTAIHGSDLDVDEYIISAPSNNRRSKIVLLNGWQLHYESSLPELQPKVIKYGDHISMPPYSIGFWVIKNTSVKIC